MFGEGESVPDKMPLDEAEIERVERLQNRRNNFFDALKKVCEDESEDFSYKEITGSDTHVGEDWIEYRFHPLKKDENLPDYEFYKFEERLMKELDSNEYFVTSYEHPTVGQVIKVEIDES